MKTSMKSDAPAAGTISPRKRMGMGKAPSGDNGVESYESAHGGMPHPDRGMGHEPMGDGDRAIGTPVSSGKNGRMGMQAAPVHGPIHKMKGGIS